MARSVRDAKLETRTARAQLKASGKPYYRAIEPELHLGYRKPQSGSGKWVVRHYVGDRKYEVETIAVADDFSDADGVAILSFAQAQNEARERMKRRAHAAAGITGPLTVKDAIGDYLDYLENNSKSAVDARSRSNAFILPSLGDAEVETLTTDRIAKWHADLAKSPARIRTKDGDDQKHKAAPSDPEARRRRKSTANRTLTVLKGALNRAWRAGKVRSDEAWRRVQPFKGVEAARVRYLSIAEAQRLINAADPDFRKIALAALHSGARYGELCRLEVADFNPDSGTLAVRQSKGGKPRHIVLTDEGIAAFKQLAMGRDGAEPMFVKNGAPWGSSHQNKPMAEACKNGKITPPISFHGLRHTWASHSVMNGMPLMVVAKNLGHADTRMVEKHYGHLAPSFVADAIRAGAPRFAIGTNSNITGIADARK
ncbi:MULTISPECIES: site-specific integrase [Hyphomicrobiales]|uniref:tyrosine-type recombinase/integrase n=1 Tax=Methylobacterium sp. CCH7-A2 TaxID=1768789 RepID=UPI0008331686|nr:MULTISPECIES: site-specific integrase [Hyphomicrobiales]